SWSSASSTAPKGRSAMPCSNGWNGSWTPAVGWLPPMVRPSSPTSREPDMDLQLRGRRALVSGSSAGIGVAIAHHLAAEGAAVVVHGRDVERTEAVAQRIRDAGWETAGARGELGTEEGDAAEGAGGP